eukprot:m51a1_g11880 hypothetical protein (309) ;mRNA; r:571873-573197
MKKTAQQRKEANPFSIFNIIPKEDPDQPAPRPAAPKPLFDSDDEDDDFGEEARRKGGEQPEGAAAEAAVAGTPLPGLGRQSNGLGDDCDCGGRAQQPLPAVEVAVATAAAARTPLPGLGRQSKDLDDDDDDDDDVVDDGHSVVVQQLARLKEQLAHRERELAEERERSARAQQRAATAEDRLRKLLEKEAAQTKTFEELTQRVEANLAAALARAQSAESRSEALERDLRNAQERLAAVPDLRTAECLLDEQRRQIDQTRAKSRDAAAGLRGVASDAAKNLVALAQQAKKIADISAMLASLVDVTDETR